MNKKLIAALGAGATILAISQTAVAGVSLGVAIGAPAPVYAAPAPAWVGWHDDRRWEERRWHEHQWQERHWDDHRWGGDRRWGDRHDDYGYRRW